MRTFAYVRVSTTGQTTENQIRKIEAAGFQLEARRVVSENISGSTAIAQRPGFMKLLDRLEAGDVLVVTKLDRLGRDAMDIRATAAKLASMGVRVHCLALGGADLTSAAGKMMMHVVGAMAEFEKDLLVERTHAGLERAKANGKTLGRTPTLSECERLVVRRKLADGASVSELARQYKTSRQTIMRARDEAVTGSQAA
jgi:putative DNA-invertase from lambdoid prophage Rac